MKVDLASLAASLEMALAVFAPCNSVGAQAPAGVIASGAPTCSYARCALRVERHPASIVQGVGATRVAYLGLFAPRLDVLATVDSAEREYNAFRDAYNGETAFGLGAGAIEFAAIAAIAVKHAGPGPTLGLAIAGAPLALAGAVWRVRAERHLDAALAYYNRSLPDGS